MISQNVREIIVLFTSDLNEANRLKISIIQT